MTHDREENNPCYDVEDSHAPRYWESQRYTPGTGALADPYLPGSAPVGMVLWPERRASPYLPGTGSIPIDEVTPFLVSDISDPLDWTAATMDADLTTQSEHESRTIGMMHVDVVNDVNILTSRVHALDARSRADYNEKISATWNAGIGTCDFTSEHAFESQPYIGLMPSWNAGAVWINAVVQNADDTWTFTMECSNPPAGNTTVYADMKSDVAETTDIDP